MSKARLDPVSEQAIDWMVRLRAGKTDARMQERFNAWLALDPAHAQAWARLQERLGGSWNTLRTLEKRLPGEARQVLLQPHGSRRDVLRAIGFVLADVPNRLTIEGHTDAKPFVGGEAGYSNWELSADRANASRRELITGGLKGDRVLRVQGLAASMLFDAQNPESPLNRRISIIVMNREAEDRVFQAAAAESSATEPPIEDEKTEQAASSPQPASR